MSYITNNFSFALLIDCHGSVTAVHALFDIFHCLIHRCSPLRRQRSSPSLSPSRSAVFDKMNPKNDARPKENYVILRRCHIWQLWRQITYIEKKIATVVVIYGTTYLPRLGLHLNCVVGLYIATYVVDYALR